MTAANSVGRSALDKTADRDLVLAALGVVYGDIGTSPLYAVRQSLVDFGDMSERAILGALSLIVWALVLVVTVKYVIVIMRADNRGEGGLLALTALVLRTTRRIARRYLLDHGGRPGRRRAVLRRRRHHAGDLGAERGRGAEGRDAAVRALCHPDLAGAAGRPVPGAAPRHGGGRRAVRPGHAGVVRGAGAARHLGASRSTRAILLALNPLYGIALLIARAVARLRHARRGVPGGDRGRGALRRYGAFRPGRRCAGPGSASSSRRCCSTISARARCCSAIPRALENPFYRLAPDWALYPLVVLASLATIIASQAVISGAFSITRQAIQLGYLPRLRSATPRSRRSGRSMCRAINRGLLVAVIVLVLGFQLVGQSRRRLRHRGQRHDGDHHRARLSLHAQPRLEPRARAAGLRRSSCVVDLTFLGANLLKIAEGGWFPIVVAAAVFTSWRPGGAAAGCSPSSARRDAMPLDRFVDTLNPDQPPRVPGTAIFMTRDLTHVPVALLHALKHYKVLHERVVMMQVETEDVPHVSDEQRLEIRELGKGFHTIRVRYGFMDEPNILRALAQCRISTSVST